MRAVSVQDHAILCILQSRGKVYVWRAPDGGASSMVIIAFRCRRKVRVRLDCAAVKRLSRVKLSLSLFVSP